MKNIIIIVALVLVAAGSWWALTRDVQNELAGIETGEEQRGLEAVSDDEDSDVVKGKGSLLSLLALGKSQECSFVVRAEGLVQEGTAFYDGGNARVDTLITGSDSIAPMATYMIMDKSSDMMYVWSSEQAGQGVKMTIPNAAPSAEVLPVTNQGVSPEVDVDYSCRPWNVDGSVFVPPADVSFTDMSEMQQMMEEFGGLEGLSPRP